MPSEIAVSHKITPVILCGGSGTRLWPVSRTELPKQFINLVSGNSMLQDTALLVSGDAMFTPPLCVTGGGFHDLLSSQLSDAGIEPALTVLEPEGRNTTAAIAMAAFALRDQDPGAMMLVMPSDHVVGARSAFYESVRGARRAAADGALVTFGMQPDRPETGYGYIRQGRALEYANNCFTVDGFREKPNLETAQEYLDSGRYHWNSGMFMFTADRFLAELADLRPGLFEQCERAYVGGVQQDRCFLPDPALFGQIDNISVDYSVMELTKSAAVVVVDFGWSDIGSWAHLADIGECDGRGNCIDGDVVLSQCEGVYVRSDHRLVAAIGLEDQVIIDTEDALLVASKDKIQDLRGVVDRLRMAGRAETTAHPMVQQPWGSHHQVHQGASHAVKHLVVAPGESLSMRYHVHRSEHWIVVGGVAQVTVDRTDQVLAPNQSVHIPAGAVHRLRNCGAQPVHLIQVHYGDYLDEADTVLLDETLCGADATVAAVA